MDEKLRQLVEQVDLLSEGQVRRNAEIQRLREALVAMRELAAVAHNGDPWYAEHEGVDAAAIFEQAKQALADSVLGETE
jgi:hypothetical protein